MDGTEGIGVSGSSQISGFSPEIFVSMVKVYTNVYEARGKNL